MTRRYALVAPIAEHKHGTATAYGYHGCRCGPCREAHTIRNGEDKRALYARRVLIDGELIAPVPDRMHGTLTTYKRHGCRCARCREANTDNARRQSQARHAARVRVKVPS